MFSLPFAFAFSAGFVALASPCGAAMLPAYIGYYLGQGEASNSQARPDGDNSHQAGHRVIRRAQSALMLVSASSFLYLVLGLLFKAKILRLISPDVLIYVLIATVVMTVLAEVLLTYRDRELALRAKLLFPRIGNALLIGGTAALAFLLLFGAFGVVWSAAGSFLRDIMPYIASFVGAALVVLGVYMVAFMLVNKRAMTLIPTIGVSWGTGSRGLASVFLFGLAYALATLSCTFPIFLAILAQGQVIGGYAPFLMVLVYGAGMGIGLIGLTLYAAVYQDMARVVLRKTIPIVEWASPMFLILAGAFIVWYWWVNWFAFSADI